MSGAKTGDRGCRVVRSNGREGVGGDGGKFRYCLEQVGGVGSRASKVLADHVLELLEGTRLNIQLPVKILAYHMLHLVDLPELKHCLGRRLTSTC